MKAILRNNRKVIVDVEHIPTFLVIQEDRGSSYRNHYYEAYREKKTGIFYRKDELDWVEYYGG